MPIQKTGSVEKRVGYAVTYGFLEAINGLFQAAKRKARGYGRFRTIRMVIFMIAGKLDFSRINPYVTA